MSIFKKPAPSCPNSEAVLRAALLATKWANSVIKFAATLNQVDLDGGYTGWTQPKFVELVRKRAEQVGYTGPIVVAVDHTGPWLKDKHSNEDWSFEDMMNAVKKSLDAASRLASKFFLKCPAFRPFRKVAVLPTFCRQTVYSIT